MRMSSGLIHHRGIGFYGGGLFGLGADSTLATAAQLPAFCASVGADAEAYPACASVSPADIAAAEANLPVGTGFALAPPANPNAPTNAQIQALLKQNAPPVYVSSFQTLPNSGSLPASYYTDQTAASVAQEVNAYNADQYSLYQNEINNWITSGAQGSPPAPPNYQTFTQAWAPNNMGGVPSSITTAAPGTALSPGTFLTGGNMTTGPTIAPIVQLTPVVSATPAPTQTTPAPLTQQQLNSAINSPPVDVTQNMPITAPINATAAPGSAGTTPTTSSSSPLSFLTQALPFTILGESIPTWVAVAAAGLGLYLLTKRH